MNEVSVAEGSKHKYYFYQTTTRFCNTTHIKPGQAYLTFALLSVAIVVLGVWLASLGDRVAAVTGLGQSFVGALLLAATTSLP